MLREKRTALRRGQSETAEPGAGEGSQAQVEVPGCLVMTSGRRVEGCGHEVLLLG